MSIRKHPVFALMRLAVQQDSKTIVRLIEQNRELKKQIYELERLLSRLQFEKTFTDTPCAICAAPGYVITNLVDGRIVSVCKPCAKTYTTPN